MKEAQAPMLAVIRVSGTGRIDDFRERVRWLMVRDADAEDYTEHHEPGRLEYRFEPRKGIPFPAFAEASAEFPELTVEAEWTRGGERGRARIEAGRVVEQAGEDAAPAGVAVELGDDGRLELAMVCSAGAGYAATHDRHTYFRYADGRLEILGLDDPDERLEALAFDFIEEWIWYDEATGPDAELERRRYAGYGHPVRGANLRSARLAQLRRTEGRHSTLDEEGERIRDALRAQWLSPR